MNAHAIKPLRLTATTEIRRVAAIVVAATMLFGTSAVSSTARATGRYECALHHAKVISRIKEDALAACEAADRAFKFLEELGLVIPREITIEIVDNMPAIVDPSALGAYIKDEERILVLHYAVIEKRREWYRIPVDREVYRGVISHEITHAVSSHNFRISEPSILAEEYIAYVTLLSTMAHAQRQHIIRLYPDDATGDDAGLRDVAVYMIDPVRFGVNAYRHFVRQESGRRFLEAILDGRAMTDLGSGS